MQKTYSRIDWENYPSEKTPLNEANLNKIDYSLNEVDNRVIALDVEKLDKATGNELVKNIELNKDTGVITITFLNGTKSTIDTLLEKVAVNFDYDPVKQKLIIILSDGTRKEVDLSALITQYEFLNSDTVAWVIGADGSVSAFIPDGSVTENKLQPNFLADVKIEAAKAENSASNALTSENASKVSAEEAKKSEETAAKLVEQAKAILSDIEFKLGEDGHLYYKTESENITFRVDPVTGQLQFKIITI